MKSIKIAKIIFKIDFIYWIIYNSIYGWNWKPINETEEILDYIFIGILYVALGFYLRPFIKNTKTTNYETNKDR